MKTKSFELKYKSGYRDLQIGDIINIKSVDNDNTVFTKNKGSKKYKLPSNLVKFLQLVSVNDCNINTIFTNPELSECLHHTSIKNHIGNLTKLGLAIYEAHDNGADFISAISWED